MGSGRFGKISPGCAASPNNTCTQPNRCEVLDGKGLGFAVRRVMPTLGAKTHRSHFVAQHATRRIIYLMIKSFKHKGLKRFFETGNVAGINPSHRQKIRIRLAALDTATALDDMDLPGFRLHPLKGDKQGVWAVDVNKNWRITFEFIDGNAYIVNYEDYH